MKIELAQEKYQTYCELLSRTAERSVTPDGGKHWFILKEGGKIFVTKEQIGEYERAKIIVENTKKKAELEEMYKLLATLNETE